MRSTLCILLIFPLFFSGMPSKPQAAGCNCPDNMPSAPSSVRRITADNHARLIAVIDTKTNTADSLARVADSLAIEVKLLDRDMRAKLVCGHVDIWREPGGKVNVWRWFFRKYPDGEMRFDTVVKRTYYHAAL